MILTITILILFLLEILLFVLFYFLNKKQENIYHTLESIYTDMDTLFNNQKELLIQKINRTV